MNVVIDLEDTCRKDIQLLNRKVCCIDTQLGGKKNIDSEYNIGQELGNGNLVLSNYARTSPLEKSWRARNSPKMRRKKST